MFDVDMKSIFYITCHLTSSVSSSDARLTSSVSSSDARQLQGPIGAGPSHVHCCCTKSYSSDPFLTKSRGVARRWLAWHWCGLTFQRLASGGRTEVTGGGSSDNR